MSDLSEAQKKRAAELVGKNLKAGLPTKKATIVAMAEMRM